MHTTSFSLHRGTLTAVFVALGVLLAPALAIPLGVMKAFPVQHAINVLLAVLLGTRYAVTGAFLISTLRLLMATATPLAYPGSMVGAFLAGVIYRRTRSVIWAAAGEVVGTGVIGGLLAYPIAHFVMGSGAAAIAFVVPFAVSSASGALIALALLPVLRRIPHTR